MNRARTGAGRRVAWRMLVGLIAIGICRPSPSALAQDTSSSAFTLVTTSATILYNTGPDAKAGGAIKIVSATAVPSPDKVNIRCDSPVGLVPDSISVTSSVTYAGKTGPFTGASWKAIKADKGVYAIPLADLVPWLIGEIDNMLPPQFDPNAAPAFSTSVDVVFTVTPADVTGFQSSATKVTTPLKITLQQVLGDPKAAAASLPKPKTTAITPSTSSRVASNLPARCPRCWTVDDDFVCCPATSTAWCFAEGTVVVQPYPIPSCPTLPTSCYAYISRNAPVSRMFCP